MQRYVKFLVPFGVGVVLVVLGVVLPDEVLRTLGYGAIGGSGFTFVVPNREAV